MSTGKIYKTNGTTEEVTPKNGINFSLQELQAAIGGGYVELVNISENRYMVVDEDGWSKNLPVNSKAFEYYPHSPICGDILICKRSQIK